MKKLHANALINSASPYLLQHAHNPVNWQPWDDKLFEEAQKTGKPVLVSIGYAACHWCHVMEHESFEDESVAKVMNEHFVCVKVDREERPDVDHYFMSVVQMMGIQGGWPLHVITLPDGRPVWGGTYFTKENWLKEIVPVVRYWEKNPGRVIEYAESLQKEISTFLFPKVNDNTIPVSRQLLFETVESWKSLFDTENGGRKGTTKFPIPLNLQFLLYYGSIKEDQQTLDFVKLTLRKMARGGIYDQIGGGFARYSTDENWKVPHFEKMLYDNGQLISIYSQAYQKFKDEEFRQVVYETVRFIERELMDETGAFYSSLDADSEGEEGKYYVWRQNELKALLKDEYPLFAAYFQVNNATFWENGKYILYRNSSSEKFSKKHNLSKQELQQKIKNWKELLLSERQKRVRPALDDKTLTSWNALVIQGLTDAFKAFGDERFMKLAVRNGMFLRENLMMKNGKIYHVWKQGKHSVSGFMEDYALTMQAFISLFEITGDTLWLKSAGKLLVYSKKHFYDEESGMFYFSEKEKKQVIANFFQNEENVMPAANSVMANNLHKLYLLEGIPEYMRLAENMLEKVTSQFKQYPYFFANWGILKLKITEPYFEIAVCGADTVHKVSAMQSFYLPNVVWAISTQKSDLSMLKERYVEGKTLIYVCREGACRLPVEGVTEAMQQIESEME